MWTYDARGRVVTEAKQFTGFGQYNTSYTYNSADLPITMTYDAENRLVSVTGAATANFTYDADGRQVKSVVGGVTTYYVGQHYEKKGTTVTKYYFAGTTRLAVRTGGTLSFLLGDHLASSSQSKNVVQLAQRFKWQKTNS